MSFTPNFNLMLTPEADTTTTFKQWRVALNGEANSNMIKIDNALKDAMDKAEKVEESLIREGGANNLGAYGQGNGYRVFTITRNDIESSGSALPKEIKETLNAAAAPFEAVLHTTTNLLPTGDNGDMWNAGYQELTLLSSQSYDDFDWYELGKRYTRYILKRDGEVMQSTTWQLVGGEYGSTEEEIKELWKSVKRKSYKGTTIIIGTSKSGHITDNCDYVCDGTDDQEEINKAINALPETGGEIILLEGTYTLSTDITISKSNVVISGAGWGTNLSSFNTSIKKMQLSSCNNCTVRNLSGVGVGVQISESSNHRLENLNLYMPFDYDTSDAIAFQSAKFCSVSNCIIEGFSTNITCSNATSITITNNILSHPQGSSISVLTNSASIIINSNIIWNEDAENAFAGSKGISINSSTCNHCIINGNVCYHHSPNIHVSGSWNTISNNQTIQNSGQKSIHIGSSGTNNLISNNIITNTAYTNDGGTSNMFANNK